MSSFTKGPAEAISGYLRALSAAFARRVGQDAFEEHSSSMWPVTVKKAGEKKDWYKQRSCNIHFLLPGKHGPVQYESTVLGKFYKNKNWMKDTWRRKKKNFCFLCKESNFNAF